MTILRFPKPPRFSESLFRATMLRRCRLEECRAACCLHGVWVDPLEKEDILRHSEAIVPFLPEGRRDPQGWFTGELEEDDLLPSGYAVASTVVPNPAHYGGTECIFLRPDGLCSLQVAAVAEGEHPWRWKPFHCIIHPMTTEDGEFTLASDEELLAEDASCFRAGARESRMNEWLAEEMEFLAAAGGGERKEKYPGD
jgi:hypothetical protein